MRLVGRVGGARPGRKVLTLVHAMIAGASHIDHADMLRAGVDGGGARPSGDGPVDVRARSCESFTFGHVRQLEAVIGQALERAWSAGAGPGAEPLVIDIDSTICEVDGNAKQGAGFGYTKVLGYHPLLATRADTGEVLHARMRKGAANTQRGARRFIDELVARVRRAGATGELTVRVDSGFWSNDTIATLNRLDVRYTMAVRCHTKGIAAAIAAIADDAWVDIDYTPDGQAQVADCAYTTGTGRRRVTRRLVVRRTRLTDTAQQRLWPDWRHHAFLTDLDGDAVDVDAFHRHHAVVELAIRDLKEGAGLEHVPSGNFHANSAWLQCAVLAHNLIRWTAILGDVRVDERADRRPHHPHPPHRHPRPARQPLRRPDPAPPDPLAMARHVHRRAAGAPRPRPRPRIAATPAVRRPAHHHRALTTRTVPPRQPRHAPPQAATSTPTPTSAPTPPRRPVSRRHDDRTNPIGGSRVIPPGSGAAVSCVYQAR